MAILLAIIVVLVAGAIGLGVYGAGGVARWRPDGRPERDGGEATHRG